MEQLNDTLSSMLYNTIKICKTCDKDFVSKKSTEALREKAKFCSLQCYWKLKPELSSGTKSPSWKGGKTKLNCKICSKVFLVDKYRSNAKTCSLECNKLFRKSEEFRLHLSEVQRSKISDELKALQHTVSKFSHMLRKSSRYSMWRERIFKRDDFTCQDCGKRGGKIHADHINPFILIILKKKIESYEQALSCSELWDISNGRTLCLGCHYKTPTFGGKMQRILTTNTKTT